MDIFFVIWVNRPKKSFLLSGDATVTIAHRCTPKEQLKELTSLADIIIAAAGNYTSDTITIHACLWIPLQFN